MVFPENFRIFFREMTLENWSKRYQNFWLNQKFYKAEINCNEKIAVCKYVFKKSLRKNMP